MRAVSTHQRDGRTAAAAQPVISVDAKKKELIGAYKNAGVEWQPKENPFPSNNMILWTRNWEKDSLWSVRPDAEQRLGERCVDHETASLAVETIGSGGTRWGNPIAGNGVINYCRLWWQQQLSQSLVEMGTATTGNWIRINHPGLPFSTRN